MLTFFMILFLMQMKCCFHHINLFISFAHVENLPQFEGNTKPNNKQQKEAMQIPNLHVFIWGLSNNLPQ